MGKINFNTLPDENSGNNSIIPKGKYRAKIAKSEMKTPNQDKGPKPDYFSAECDVTDPASGTPMGKFWINLYESNANLCQWQLKKFIEALSLPIEGEFELKDLTKMVNGKELMVDIKVEQDNRGNDRSVVDINAGDCFYPVANDSVIENVFTPPTTGAAEPAVMSQY